MTADEFKKKCRGIIPVQYCPYMTDFNLDIEGLKKNSQFLVDFALDGDKEVVIMTNGSTTESYANSIKEQKIVIETVVETVNGKIPVIAGTSQAGTRETIKMTKYAEKVGADCAMVVLPFYHTPFKEGMYKHYKRIADSVKIGIMIYNNPAVSGSIIDPELMARLSKIENIVAVKDNSPTVSELFFKTLLINTRDMSLICGRGEIQYIAAAAYGYKYKGFVTFIGNFAPQLSYELYEAIEKERNFIKANEIFYKTAKIWQLLRKLGNPPIRETTSILAPSYRAPYIYMGLGKAAMDLVPGLTGGPCRLPMECITDKEKSELKNVLKELKII